MSIMSVSEALSTRYNEVCERVAAAAKKSGRSAGEIILVAVTKYAVPEQIKGLLALGHRDFGENTAQVLIQHAAIVDEFFTRQSIHLTTRKVRSMEAAESLFANSMMELKPITSQPGSREGIRWHMIGHVQRNKAKKVAEISRLIHSVDSLRLAEELQAIAIKRDQPIDVLLQVNCSGEPQKFGCPPAAAIPLAEQISSMINIRVRGLMTLAAQSATAEEARPCFGRCRELFEEMAKLRLGENVPFNILSMGMSGDYEVAIAEGANIVRVGSAIFGDGAPNLHAEPEERDEPE